MTFFPDVSSSKLDNIFLLVQSTLLIKILGVVWGLCGAWWSTCNAFYSWGYFGVISSLLR
ncbi:hypothetical protein VFMJ11_B0052 (plasmid) [Aliivibrio fischeri MJ11]|uniref:Uncharacterized protein n=1 Tax=Aliivibrio fischeri (strain MJ11) TaxID=388396 RepID=B5EVZ5_ALIFM|nr:hypothetical protein VFMJ11_B0052 [Aliivibrio fischeri MJ11]